MIRYSFTSHAPGSFNNSSPVSSCAIVRSNTSWPSSKSINRFRFDDPSIGLSHSNDTGIVPRPSDATTHYTRINPMHIQCKPGYVNISLQSWAAEHVKQSPGLVLLWLPELCVTEVELLSLDNKRPPQHQPALPTTCSINGRPHPPKDHIPVILPI